MNNISDRAGQKADVRLGLLLVVFAVSLCKGYEVARTGYASQEIWTASRIFLGDLSFLSVLLLLEMAISLSRGPAKYLLSVVSASFAALYLLDSYLVILFDQRLGIDDLVKYSTDFTILATFFDFKVLLIIALFIALLWTGKVSFSRKAAKYVILLSLASAMASAFYRQESSLVKYSSNPGAFLNTIAFRAGSQEPYSNADIAVYSKLASLDVQLDLAEPYPNIILVVVESLSSVDSYRTSGLRNKLPNFDRISQQGKLFTNFFATYPDSEGGIISLLSAVPPLPYPGSTRNLFNSYAYKDSVPKALARKGYHSELLTTQPISWNNMDHYISNIGFESFRGRDQVPLFRNAPRYAFDSPEDRFLYKMLAERSSELEQMKRPYFIAAVTISSHLPWTDPAGVSDTEENVWKYVDAQLGELPDRLNKVSFFENGILLITGDHRKMSATTEAERELYGDSASARIPLVAIGKGISKGVVDHRFFQQSNLMSKLNMALYGGEELSEDLIQVERFTDPNLRVTHPGDTRVFESMSGGKKSYPLFVEGNSLKWKGDFPSRQTRIERAIHAQRALMQGLKFSRPGNCKFGEIPAAEPTSENGLDASIYAGIEITGPIPLSREPLQTRVIERVNFPENLTGLTERPENLAAQIDGFLNISEAGQYKFRLESDDGSCLMLDDKMIIDGNEPKAFGPLDGKHDLKPGMHRLLIRYFQGSGEAGLVLSWSRPGESEWEVVPRSAFHRRILK